MASVPSGPIATSTPQNQTRITKSKTAASIANADSKQLIAEKPNEAISSNSRKGEAELALARGFLHENATAEETVQGVQQLWLAVQKGSTEAEVDLADLYIHGQAVSKNCDQARVLLTAASNANNSAAIDKLKTLDESCPEGNPSALP